jgi:hypothetical protein
MKGVICNSVTHPDCWIEAAGVRYRFDFSEQFGPLLLTSARGDVRENQDAPAAFWDAVSCWQRQGCAVADGLCVWVDDTPPEPQTVHLFGSHYAIVPDGADPEAVRAEWVPRVQAQLTADRRERRRRRRELAEILATGKLPTRP